MLDDGRRVAAACLNSPAYRAFCKEWADWVLDCGVDSVFWDEPAWVVPAHVGIDDADALELPLRALRRAVRRRAAARARRRRCGRSARPRSSTSCARSSRTSPRAAARTRSAFCRRPKALTASPTGTSVASLPGLTTFATDPYWKHWDEAAGPFVRRFARLLRETCDRARRRRAAMAAELRSYADEIPELEAAIAAAREEGVDDLWTWGYEACGHMTSLATPDAPLVWEAVSAALTGRRRPPRQRSTRLELRSTRELVGLLNDEDATVAGAVAEAGDALAAAIDAIAARLARGGRLVYVGAGTSGRLATLDASSAAPTFGSPPGEVVAVVAGEARTPRTTASAARPTSRPLGVGADDAVVAVSASGTTPYTCRRARSRACGGRAQRRCRLRARERACARRRSRGRGRRRRRRSSRARRD